MHFFSTNFKKEDILIFNRLQKMWRVLLCTRNVILLNNNIKKKPDMRESGSPTEGSVLTGGFSEIQANFS